MILVLSSCMLGGSGSDCDGGTYGYCTDYVKCIDTLTLDSSINRASPDTIYEQIEFINNNGFTTFFNKNNDITYYNEENLLYKSVQVKCGTLSCYDYYRSPVINISYKAANVPFNYAYQLANIPTTNSYKYLKDSILSGYGVASVYVNSNEFQLPFNRKNYKNGRMVDSIEINTKTYYNVHQIYLDSASVNATIIKPIGIYYKEDIGLIAFYLTNGETWGLK